MRRDFLEGLKENVIVGKKIPAGTGLKKYRKLFVNTKANHEAEQARQAQFEEIEDY